MVNNVKLSLEGITKCFGNNYANKNISFDVNKGEILAILGENGSGKTTLMNMIAGIYFPDDGKIYVDGEEVSISSPGDAFKYGIGMIHQHFKLVDVFTAAQNIILGVNDGKKYNLNEVNNRVSEIASQYGFQIDPEKPIHEMSVSEKQTVEIIKVLYRGAELLILDEPTAVLTPQEIEKLFEVLRNMRKDGKSIIIITHKLNEVMDLSDRVVVLRKGEYIGSVKTSETNAQELTEMMVGKKVSLNIERSEVKNPENRIELRHLTSINAEGVKVLDDITLDIRGGEILGIAGIAGSGQRELLESIAGLQPLSDGQIIFHNPKKNRPVTFFHKTIEQIMALAIDGAFHNPDGSPFIPVGIGKAELTELVNQEKVLFNEDEVVDLRGMTPLQIRDFGVKLSFVPEDRLGMGLVGNMNLVDNMMLRSYRKGKSVLLDRKKPEILARKVVEDLEVVTPGVKTPVRTLSGGNIQKILVGREIASSPKVFMAAYPVRGLDINSSYLIYHLLNEQKNKGTAVVFVGEDLDVLMGLCDRIAVIASGHISGIVDGRTATKEEIGVLMTKHNETEAK